MKIGFIGAGNMATAIIHGLIHKEVIDAKNIFASSGHFEEAQALATATGITPCKTNQEVVANVDVLILAVKPNILPIVLPEISVSVKEHKSVLVSIAAGVTLEQLATMLNLAEQPIIRIMPNVNVSVEAGVSAICGNEHVSTEAFKTVQTLFEAVGSVYELAEKDFSTFVGLAGSSPAFVYMFIDAMARAGVLNGMPKKVATEIAAKAVLGSAKRLIEGGENPWELVDQVSSPGGTTVEGVVALEKDGFIPTIINGVDATIKKDQKMQQ